MTWSTYGVLAWMGAGPPLSTEAYSQVMQIVVKDLTDKKEENNSGHVHD